MRGCGFGTVRRSSAATTNIGSMGVWYDPSTWWETAEGAARSTANKPYDVGAQAAGTVQSAEMAARGAANRPYDVGAQVPTQEDITEGAKGIFSDLFKDIDLGRIFLYGVGGLVVIALASGIAFRVARG